MAIRESDIPVHEQEQGLKVVEGPSALQLQFTQRQIDAMRNTVAKGATDDEFEMFMHLAKTYQLDPFKKEIWFIKMGGVPTIYASRDGFLSHAQRQPDFIEMVSHEVCEGDEFSYDPITGEISHKITAKRGKVTMAYSIMRRKNKPDHIVTVPFDEYFNALSGKNGVWKSHPTMMIRKVTEVINCKQTCGIHGLYAPEEMGTDGPPAMDVEYTIGDVVDDKATQRTNRSTARTTPTSQPSETKEDRVAAINQLLDFASPAGFDGDGLKEFGTRVTGKPANKWNLADIAHIRTAIESHVADQESAGHGEQSTLLDGLPDDDDLPF